MPAKTFHNIFKNYRIGLLGFALFVCAILLLARAPRLRQQDGSTSPAYAIPADGSAAPMSPIAATASSASATNWQTSTGTGGPFVSAVALPINTTLTPQTFQMLNPGNAYSSEASSGAFGFTIGDTAGGQQPGWVNAEPLSPSVMAHVSINNSMTPPGGSENESLARSDTGTSGLFAISDSPGAVDDISVVNPTVSLQSTPESATAPLIGIGLLGMAWLLRRLGRSSKFA
jgi:hypothetical protein